MSTIKITDTTQIDSITFLYPELMSPEADKEIRALNAKLLQQVEELNNLREQVRQLERELEVNRNTFHEISRIAKITFKTKEKEVIKGTTNMGIHGLGNETLGTFSS